MTVWLAQIDAADAAGAAVSMRFTTHNDAAATTLDGQTWWPAIVQLPTLRHDFFDGDFAGQIAAPTGEIIIADLVGVAGARQDLAALRWASARIRLWRGALGAAFGAFVLTFDGRITAQPQCDGGRLSLSLSVDDRWLDKPLLGTFAGSGGAEGPAGLAGQVKPLLFGAPRFAPAVLIDADNLVWQLSSGAINAVEVAFDRLARFGASAGNYASLAALIAAVIPNGGWATCLALGLVRHGAPHDGQASWHVQGDSGGAGGWVRKPGAIIARIAALAGGAVSSASLTALDASRPWNISLALTEQVTPRELIQQIAASIGAVAGVNWLGDLWCTALDIGTASLTLRSDGSALPAVASVRAVPIGAPFWRLAAQADVTHVVHTLAEAAYDYVYRGAFDVARIYRLDDAVTTTDGSMWIFVGATPASGSAPAIGNANWAQQMDAQPTTTLSRAEKLNALIPWDAEVTARDAALVGSAAALGLTGASENRLLYSEQLDHAGWDDKVGCTVTANDATYGGVLLEKLVFDGTSGQRLGQITSAANAPNGVYELAFQVYSPTARDVVVGLTDGGTGGTGGTTTVSVPAATLTRVAALKSYTATAAIDRRVSLSIVGDPASENRALWSEQLDHAGWSYKSNATVTANDATYGGVLLDKIVFASGAPEVFGQLGITAANMPNGEYEISFQLFSTAAVSGWIRRYDGGTNGLGGFGDTSGTAFSLAANTLTRVAITKSFAATANIDRRFWIQIADNTPATIWASQAHARRTSLGTAYLTTTSAISEQAAGAGTIWASKAQLRRTSVSSAYLSTTSAIAIVAGDTALIALDGGRSGYTGWRDGLSPAWNDTSADTNIVRATKEAVQSGYTAAMDGVDARIADEAAKRATWATVAGAGKPADNATVGATWGTNLSGQPSDAALLNANQTWAQVSGAGRPADNATVGADLLTNVANKSLANLDGTAATKLGTIATGADVTASVTPSVTGNTTWAIAADSAGTITTALPETRVFTALQGATDVSPTTAFTLLAVSPALSMTVDNTPSAATRGNVIMGSGTTGGGSFTLHAVLPSGGVVDTVVTVTKTNAAAPTGGGSGATYAQDTTFTTINSTTHTTIGGELTVRSDASQHVRITVDLVYGTGFNRATTPKFKVAYATSTGGSLTDLFTEEAGSTATGQTDTDDAIPGSYFRATTTFTMPAANTDYFFKLLGRNFSGSTTFNTTFTGTAFTVQQ